MTSTNTNTRPRVAVIILTWNRVEDIVTCLESFACLDYPNYEVIIVDNASGDDTPALLARLAAEHANVTVIANTHNLGFAAANNQGIGKAGGEIVVFLNNDTVVTTGWLWNLVRHLDNESIGIVGAVTNFAGNEAKIDVPYCDLDGLEPFSAAYTTAHAGQVFDLRVVALYCAAMRRRDLMRIGGLDERYEIGMFEDDDLAEAVRRLGLRVVCAEDVFIHHVGQASFALLSRRRYDVIFEQNRRLYEKKWQIKWIPHQVRAGVTPPTPRVQAA